MDNPKPPVQKRTHTITIENRSKAFLTGVNKVISSNESSLLLETSEGGLSVQGANLKISKYDMEAGTLSFEGSVNGLKYSAAKEPVLKKLFR